MLRINNNTFHITDTHTTPHFSDISSRNQATRLPLLQEFHVVPSCFRQMVYSR